jgi:hypothetical protein
MATIKLLVVGGGAGVGGGVFGSTYNSGGGGGQVVYNASYTIDPTKSYKVTVGAGGSVMTDNSENSSFESVVANKGSVPVSLSSNGGTSGSGYAGGTYTGSGLGGCGGGGDSSVGLPNVGNTGGAGGAGTTNSISGVSVTYGAGGIGGPASSVDGALNTGTGGGGQNGVGGSGVVIIRYVTADFSSYNISGGVVTTDGSETIRTFYDDGYLIFYELTDPKLTSVECWGSGGIGIDVSSGSGSGGGGGGAYAKKNDFYLSPYLYTGTSYSFPIKISVLNTHVSFNGGFCVADYGRNSIVGSVSGGSGGLAANSIGDVVYSGGNGGNGNNSYDTSGGGGGCAGPDGNGINGSNAGSSAGGSGGAGNNGSGGAGSSTVGVAGTSNVLGGGGGCGGGNNQGGSNGGYPGAGGGGGEAGAGYGAYGQVRIKYVSTDFSNCTGGTKTTDGIYTIHTFTSDDTFTIEVKDAPIVTTQDATSIGATTATANGNITNTNGENPYQRGVVYGAVTEDITFVPIINPSFELSAVNGWSSFSGATISQSSTQKKYGSYSLKIVNGASANAGAYQVISSSYIGKTVTVGCWVWADTPNNARLTTYGGVYSAYHSGGSTWEFLTITSTVSATAQQVYCISDVPYSTSYFDGYLAAISNGTVYFTFDSGDYSTGAYTNSITGLISRTLYRSTAFASNSAGTGYGANKSFTTIGFTNPGNIYASDDTYSTLAATSGVLTVEVSKNAGSTWSIPKTVTFTASDSTQTCGSGSTELWGSSWTRADMVDAKFYIRLSQGNISQVYKTFGFTTATESLTGIEIAIEGKYASSTISLDHLKVKIYYGNSVLPIVAGSMAYSSNFLAGNLMVYDGIIWRCTNGQDVNGVLNAKSFRGDPLNVDGKTRDQLNTLFNLDTTGAFATAWNYSGGGGEMNLFINRDGGNMGGLTIYDFPNTSGNPTMLMGITGDGRMNIGGTAPNANAILDVQSTTKAFMPPRMTTVQRDAISSPTEGMLIYNTTDHRLEDYNGSSWAAV